MVEKISLQNTHQFSSFFLDYVANNELLEGFYFAPPTIEGFEKKIASSQYSQEQRQSLVQQLAHQYENSKCSEAVNENINSIIDSSTFTVTTGHQLNIFTGPLYFIYKIATTIALAQRLKTHFPNNHFVPVYWMATEDHDFEEINNFFLFGKTFTWNSTQKGAVGRFALDGLEEILSQIVDMPQIFVDAYHAQPTLSKAARYFVNEIFGNYGLLIVDADNPDSKKAFSSIAKEELLNQSALPIVAKTNTKLEARGYKPQAHVRPINLFYLKDNIRERIIVENDVYKVLNTDLQFSQSAILDMAVKSPELLSPNVILRPLYQEALLPNIAYIGGPSEIIYWLQLKDLFAHHHLPFPILMPRNFAMVIPKQLAQKITKLQLSSEEIFLSDEELKNKILKSVGAKEVSLENQLQKSTQLFDELAAIAIDIDKSLDGYIQSERHKAAKALEEIEKKLKKAEERKNEDSFKHLATIKNKLFPNNGLQERTENYLNFAINDPAFVDKIVHLFDPFDFQFNILVKDE